MMTKIPIVTQNFSSPNVLTDTPLMLLPQPPPLPLPDRDQEGFSQLLLHDLHRHRQSYVRSYTAFETLKKRQDFVLRQESLRSLQNVEQRLISKQEQFVDQSIHSYEQCFVKVINGDSSSSTHPHQDPQRSARNSAPSFDKYHLHQLSHVPATPLEPPPIIPFHRYQKSHRPRTTAKYRSHPSIQRSAQCFHDAFHSSSFLHQSQPFVSFTENYLQKYGDRPASSARYPMTTVIDQNESQQNQNGQQQQQQQQKPSNSTETKHPVNGNRNQEPRIKSSEFNRLRATISSRNTNTPSSTPQMTYQDALHDGLTLNKDHGDQREKLHSVAEQRRLSQQSSGQGSQSRSLSRRPKSGKKKQQIVVDLTAEKKKEVLTTMTNDGDLLKQAMFVQNYGNNSSTTGSMDLSKLDRSQVSTTSKTLPMRKTHSLLQPPSTETDGPLKTAFDQIDTQMTTTTLLKPNNQSSEPSAQQQTLSSIPPPLADKKLSTEKTTGEPMDPAKRLRRGPVDPNESMKDMLAFEFELMGRQRGVFKKTRFQDTGKISLDDGSDKVRENQGTFDLLEKIRQSATGITLGQFPVSQKNCRFELPFDLKLLESSTPLEYLSKYCRLSPRRNYHFKRIFDKYRNNQYRFDSTNLFQSMRDVHAENFTQTHFGHLCQLIDIGKENHQLSFETFAGVMALSERILCDSEEFRSGLDEHDLAKDTVEKCDFDSLDRKLDGLTISETMRKLLKAL